MQEFRVERKGEHWLLLGGILPKDAVRIGQRWLSSDGHEVEVLAVDDQWWVTYGWVSCASGEQHEWDKDNFSFQCKYSLIL